MARRPLPGSFTPSPRSSSWPGLRELLDELEPNDPKRPCHGTVMGKLRSVSCDLGLYVTWSDVTWSCHGNPPLVPGIVVFSRLVC